MKRTNEERKGRRRQQQQQQKSLNIPDKINAKRRYANCLRDVHSRIFMRSGDIDVVVSSCLVLRVQWTTQNCVCVEHECSVCECVHVHVIFMYGYRIDCNFVIRRIPYLHKSHTQINRKSCNFFLSLLFHFNRLVASSFLLKPYHSIIWYLRNIVNSFQHFHCNVVYPILNTIIAKVKTSRWRRYRLFCVYYKTPIYIWKIYTCYDSNIIFLFVFLVKAYKAYTPLHWLCVKKKKKGFCVQSSLLLSSSFTITCKTKLLYKCNRAMQLNVFPRNGKTESDLYNK